MGAVKRKSRGGGSKPSGRRCPMFPKPKANHLTPQHYSTTLSTLSLAYIFLAIYTSHTRPFPHGLSSASAAFLAFAFSRSCEISSSRTRVRSSASSFFSAAFSSASVPSAPLPGEAEIGDGASDSWRAGCCFSITGAGRTAGGASCFAGGGDGSRAGAGAGTAAGAGGGAEVVLLGAGAEAEDTAPVSRLTSLSEGSLPEKNSGAVSEGSAEGAGGKISDWNESACTRISDYCYTENRAGVPCEGR